MARAHSYDDEEDDDWEDDESDFEDDDVAASLIECPNCGADVYEETVRCPLCGEYITRSNSPWNGKPMWWRVAGMAGIVALIAGLIFSLR